jgi:hypothetical protein
LDHVWTAPPRGMIQRALAALIDPHIAAEVAAAPELSPSPAPSIRSYHVVGAGQQQWRDRDGPVLISSRLAGACAYPRHLLHGSQGFDETAIAQADNADAGVVQVDRHPQSDRKNDPVNGVE